MTGCAVCSAANILVRFGKAIPRLSDGTPNMKALGARMGKRHRDAAAAGDPGDRHGLSLQGQCTGGTNWCAYCVHLELKANGVPSSYAGLSWSTIEYHLKKKHPISLPGRYGAFPIVGTMSYSSTLPARGRSDTGFTGPHMVVAWQSGSVDSTGTPITFIVSDPDFGSLSRPVVPPHSVISRAVLRRYWELNGKWPVCVVTVAPPVVVPPIAPWWGSDVRSDIKAAYSARAVALKLRELHITNYGKAINNSDMEAGLKARGINFGTVVNLVDVRYLMKPGTGDPT